MIAYPLQSLRLNSSYDTFLFQLMKYLLPSRFFYWLFMGSIHQNLAEYSESLRELGACLLEKIALNDDEDSGNVTLHHWYIVLMWVVCCLLVVQSEYISCSGKCHTKSQSLSSTM